MTVMAGEDDEDMMSDENLMSDESMMRSSAARGSMKKKPDFSLEWKDLKIEIKVYGKVGCLMFTSGFATTHVVVFLWVSL